MTEFSTILCINCGQSTGNVVRAGGRIRSNQEWCEGCRHARDNTNTGAFRTAVAAQMRQEAPPIAIPAEPGPIVDAEPAPQDGVMCGCGSTSFYGTAEYSLNVYNDPDGMWVETDDIVETNVRCNSCGAPTNDFSWG